MDKKINNRFTLKKNDTGISEETKSKDRIKTAGATHNFTNTKSVAGMHRVNLNKTSNNPKKDEGKNLKKNKVEDSTKTRGKRQNVYGTGAPSNKNRKVVTTAQDTRKKFTRDQKEQPKRPENIKPRALQNKSKGNHEDKKNNYKVTMSEEDKTYEKNKRKTEITNKLQRFKSDKKFKDVEESGDVDDNWSETEATVQIVHNARTSSGENVLQVAEKDEGEKLEEPSYWDNVIKMADEEIQNATDRVEMLNKLSSDKIEKDIENMLEELKVQGDNKSTDLLEDHERIPDIQLNEVIDLDPREEQPATNDLLNKFSLRNFDQTPLLMDESPVEEIEDDIEDSFSDSSLPDSIPESLLNLNEKESVYLIPIIENDDCLKESVDEKEESKYISVSDDEEGHETTVDTCLTHGDGEMEKDLPSKDSDHNEYMNNHLEASEEPHLEDENKKKTACGESCLDCSDSETSELDDETLFLISASEDSEVSVEEMKNTSTEDFADLPIETTIELKSNISVSDEDLHSDRGEDMVTNEQCSEEDENPVKNMTGHGEIICPVKNNTHLMEYYEPMMSIIEVENESKITINVEMDDNNNEKCSNNNDLITCEVDDNISESSDDSISGESNDNVSENNDNISEGNYNIPENNDHVYERNDNVFDGVDLTPNEKNYQISDNNNITIEDDIESECDETDTRETYTVDELVIRFNTPLEEDSNINHVLQKEALPEEFTLLSREEESIKLEEESIGESEENLTMKIISSGEGNSSSKEFDEEELSVGPTAVLTVEYNLEISDQVTNNEIEEKVASNESEEKLLSETTECINDEFLHMLINQCIEIPLSEQLAQVSGADFNIEYETIQSECSDIRESSSKNDNSDLEDSEADILTPLPGDYCSYDSLLHELVILEEDIPSNKARSFCSKQLFDSVKARATSAITWLSITVLIAAVIAFHFWNQATRISK